METLAPLERESQKEREKRKRKGGKWAKSLHKLWQTGERSALMGRKQAVDPAHWECSLLPTPTLSKPHPPLVGPAPPG